MASSTQNNKEEKSNLIDLNTPVESNVENLSITNDDTKDKNPIPSQPAAEAEDLPPSYQTVSSSGSQSQPFKAINHVKDLKVHMLLAATGSLCTEILPAIISELKSSPGVVIHIILDKAAAEKVSAATLLELPRVGAVYTDADWHGANSMLHFELRSWLDFMLIAPCDQSTLAKIATGLGDDLVSTIVRVFDTDGMLNPPGRQGRYKYLAIAPAMDSATWAHPVTKDQLDTLKNRWCYSRKFEKDHIPWVTTIKPRDYYAKATPFDAYEDNCNMNVARILQEARWQLDKFRKGHEWYVPGQ